MGSRPFPEIACVICKKPVDQHADLWLTKTARHTRGLLRQADYFSASSRDVGQQLSISTNPGDARRQQLL
jgi:hypothetical protein